MNTYLLSILALLVCTGQGLYAEDFATPGSTVAVTTPVAEVEPYVWPVAKKIGTQSVRIVSKFGHRKVPSPTAPAGAAPLGGVEEMHEGIDFALPVGSNVRAAHSGKVLFAGFSSAYVSRAKKSEKSHLVIVRHADATSTRYVHLDRLKVRPGAELQAGDVLGTSSASDEWSDPVLHFEIRDASGKAIDPMVFLAETGKPQ